jgi:hypothetical protein
VLERLPFEELHGDKPSRVALIDFVNGADIRVIERRGRLRLTLEAGQRLLEELGAWPIALAHLDILLEVL